MTAHIDGITSAQGLGAASRLARYARKSAIMGSTAVALAFGASAAQAQCVGTGDLAHPLFQAFGGGLGTVANSFISSLLSLNTAYLTQTGAFVGSPPSPQANQLGGGTWVRSVAGRADVENTSTFGNVSIIGNNLTGNVTCQNKSRQDFMGFQVGQDIARLNLGNSGWNVHIGATGGYGESESKNVRGTGEGRLQVPFVGAYMAVTGGGGFFAELQGRADFYHASLSQVDLGIRNQGLEARSHTFLASAGYNMRFGPNNTYFFEPSAQFIYTKFTVDTLNALVTTPFGDIGGSAKINDFNSQLGRLGARVGTSFNAGSLALQPFVSASVWHEFAGDVITSFAGDLASTGLLTSTRVGTFGQYGVGVTGQVLNTGWLGYARLDYRKGDNIEGTSVNGGVRYQFTPESRGAVSARF
jgi:hypothetical protein